MSYELLSQPIESPLINAAGSISGTNLDTILLDVDVLAKTPIGAITVGSFTEPEQGGNEAKHGGPVYYYDPETGLNYNSIGLKNIGRKAAVQAAPEIQLRVHDKGKLLIYSGSPTLDPENKYGSSVDQAAKLAYEFLTAGVDIVELNVSCPNVVTEGGGRKPIMGYDLESIEELSETLKKMVGEGHNLGIKVPPYISPSEKAMMPDVAKILRANNVFKFITTSNTIPNQVPVDVNRQPILSVPGGKGGMSGPGTRVYGRQQLMMWESEVGSSLEIISTLGVNTGKELALRRRLGAAAAGGVTFLWESRDWSAAVNEMLQEYAAAGAP